MIADFEITEKMLRHFIGRVHGEPLRPPAADDVRSLGHHRRRAPRPEEACLAAGARSVQLIEEPLAAAIGAGLPIDEPRANMVVDVGGGTSEVAVISLGGIVVSRSLRVGRLRLRRDGGGVDPRHHGLAIGETTAERVKLEVGSVDPDLTDVSS